MEDGMKPIALLLFALGAFTAGGEEKKALNIEDPFILLADSMCEASSPADPDPGSWGMDPATGKFVHPEATPHQHGTVSFEGELDHWDTNEYAKNVKVEAYYPWVVSSLFTLGRTSWTSTGAATFINTCAPISGSSTSRIRRM